MKLLTVKEVMQRLTVSRTQLWIIRRTNPDFPRARRLGPNRIAFVAEEIDAWIASLPVDGDGGR